ncbi:hypothetical protein BKA81DRAFT_110894 [Phyllosticta paracitricarpa]
MRIIINLVILVQIKITNPGFFLQRVDIKIEYHKKSAGERVIPHLDSLPSIHPPFSSRPTCSSNTTSAALESSRQCDLWSTRQSQCASIGSSTAASTPPPKNLPVVFTLHASPTKH